MPLVFEEDDDVADRFDKALAMGLLKLLLLLLPLLELFTANTNE